MLDLDALNPAPEPRHVQRAEDDALAAMVGKFALWMLGLGVFFGLGVAAFTGSSAGDRVVYVARAAQVEAAPAAAVTDGTELAVVREVRTERQAAAAAPRLSGAAGATAADATATGDVDARYRALVAASERDVAQLEERARERARERAAYARNVAASGDCRVQGKLRAEDGSCVSRSFYDRPAKPERKADTSSSESSGGMVTAEDGSRVPKSFYDRTDYNRNGVVDQEEGWPKNPDPDDVQAGRR